MALKKISLFPLFPRYLILYHLFREHIGLKFSENKGDRFVYLLLHEKNKSVKFQTFVKSKIVTFASQSIIEFKQFLTKPNLTCSVAKMIVDFFRF